MQKNIAIHVLMLAIFLFFTINQVIAQETDTAGPESAVTTLSSDTENTDTTEATEISEDTEAAEDTEVSEGSEDIETAEDTEVSEGSEDIETAEDTEGSADAETAEDTETETTAVSQEKVTLSGTITDAGNGDPIKGVTVLIKGTAVSATSDEDGKYSLEAENSDVTLLFTLSGYTTREIPAHGETTISAALTSSEAPSKEADSSALNLGSDVVVGYGTQKKVDLTGAVTSVKTDELVQSVTANVVSSLQGAASGVYVTQKSGKPGGSGLDIQIRGLKSLTASNKPLYVIDGLPLAPGAEDIMGEINPADIQSIDILKDAASSAIYGSRGANGVVLITTKRGTKSKEGDRSKFKVNYSFYTGMTEIVQKLDLFNGPEWLQMKKDAYAADGQDSSNSNILDATQLKVVESGEWVDWQDELFKRGNQMNNNVSVSGGTDKMQALFSIGNYDEKGIFDKSAFNRKTGRLNIDYLPTSKLKLSASVMVSRTYGNVAGGDSTIRNEGSASAAGLSVLQSPAAQLRDKDGNLQLFVNAEKAISNPLYLIQESDDENWRNRVMASTYASYEFIPGLKYKLSGGTEYTGYKWGRYQTRAYNDGGKNLAILGFGQGLNYSVDNLLTYKKALNDIHNIDVTLLYGIQSNTLDSLEASSKNIPTDDLRYDALAQGTEMQKPKRNLDEWKLESYMGRVRYSLLDKYLLTVSARIDGSSKFGKDNRYGFFPSAAVAWKIDQEEFMYDVTAIDILKLRLSAGTIGNQDIPTYRSLAQNKVTRYSFNGTVVAGSNVETLPNPNLKWETTREMNVGIDFGLFNSRLDGSFEAYVSNTTDLLLKKSISSANGFKEIYDNIGETKSMGVEANIIGRIIRSADRIGFNWNLSANFAAEKNEIVSTSLYDTDGTPTDDIGNKWFIGESMKSNYDYVFDGIWQEDQSEGSLMPSAKAGDIRVKDLNGDGKITSDDRKVIGSELPTWYGGATNTFSFMGIELSTFFVARFGVQRLNGENNRGMTGRFNALKVNYWTPENHSNDYVRPHSNNESPQYLETLLYEDASYIALKNISLSYSLPKSILEKFNVFSHLKVYVQGTNLKYWTKYQSYNPESDFMAYPMTRTYGFGINAGI